MKLNYQWQGEPVKYKFGNCIVRENREKPMWWYNFECLTNKVSIGMECIPVIQVIPKSGRSFMIANHFGIGHHKLINGGWPNYAHFSVDGEFSDWPELRYDEFDHEGYSEHEAARRKWQKEKYPEEFERMEALRKTIKFR